MSWIKELDENMFKEFILSEYAEWLDDWVGNMSPTGPHRKRLVEVQAELDKVRGCTK